ncbi:MAG: GMC family oxidoreductase [Gammaproteobacteria bacterium]
MSSVGTLIIGSGVAAAAVAKRLLDYNPSASILMLEAGQRVKMQEASIWQDYLVTGKLPYTKYYDRAFPERDQPGENVNAGKTSVTLNGARVFTYGGSTIHWGGWSFRMKPEDFTLAKNTGRGIDWPFAYEDFEKYYGIAEHYLGVSGDSTDQTVARSTSYPFPAFPYTLEDQPMIAALKSRGLSYSHLPIARRGVSAQPSRDAPCQTTGTCKYCPFGARYSANNYIDNMLHWGHYPNLQIQLGAVVQQLIMSSKNRVAAVEFLDSSDGNLKRISAHRVIVAAGAIESAKLLKRSRSDFWPAGVGNAYDLIGRHIVTHPYFIFQGTQKSSNLKRLQPEMNFPTLVSRHFDSAAEQAEGKFILVNPPGSPKVDLAKMMRRGNGRAEIERAVDAPATFEIHGMVEVFGDHSNYIDNHPMPNFIGIPQTLVDYSEDPGFSARMAKIQSVVSEVFEAMDTTLTGKPSVSWRADHAACTVRMHSTPEVGVVNENLRVHNVDNLFVCSNGVFPNLGAVNPTLTLTGLAFRLGDHLAQDDGGAS